VAERFGSAGSSKAGAVEFGKFRQQPVADLVVQCRLDPPAGR
jgi:hypothetical protein